jgi:drug/metabolite transporter (DMT)-like permease
MTPDRPLLGVLLMLGFCILAPLGDGTAKILGASIPVAQIVTVRFAAQVLILLPLIWITGASIWMSPRALRLTAIRTALHIIGVGAMFQSLKFLPLADALAIAFVMPFIMLLLGKYVLGEEIGARRLGACIVGFIGTLLVVQPSFAAVGLPALLPLLVAVVFALFMLVTRAMAKEVDPMGMQAVSGIMASVVLIPLLWFTDDGTIALLDPVWPTAREWWLLVFMSVLGTGAHLLMTWSLRFAPSATLAPMQYIEIPFATLIGWLFFRDLPNGLAAIGIAVTVAAGLYVILRERNLSREMPPMRVPAPPAAE